MVRKFDASVQDHKLNSNGTRTEEMGSCVACSPPLTTSSSIPSPNARSEDIGADVVVAGSIAVDFSCDYLPKSNTASHSQPQLHTSNPSIIRQTIGGVAHNIASALRHLGTEVLLCSRVANDLSGSTILASLARRKLSTSGIRVIDGEARTAQYISVNDAHKTLVVAMADMDIIESEEGDFNQLWRHHLDSNKPRWFVVDTNWSSSTLRKWLHAGKASGAKVAVEPVSVAKSKQIFDRSSDGDMHLGVVPNNIISLASPNALELGAMYEAASAMGFFEREDWLKVIDSFELSSSGSRPLLVSLTSMSLVDRGVPQQNIQLLPYIPCILTTLGEDGGISDRVAMARRRPIIMSRLRAPIY